MVVYKTQGTDSRNYTFVILPHTCPTQDDAQKCVALLAELRARLGLAVLNGILCEDEVFHIRGVQALLHHAPLDTVLNSALDLRPQTMLYFVFDVVTSKITLSCGYIYIYTCMRIKK